MPLIMRTQMRVQARNKHSTICQRTAPISWNPPLILSTWRLQKFSHKSVLQSDGQILDTDIFSSNANPNVKCRSFSCWKLFFENVFLLSSLQTAFTRECFGLFLDCYFAGFFPFCTAVVETANKSYAGNLLKVFISRTLDATTGLGGCVHQTDNVAVVLWAQVVQGEARPVVPGTVVQCAVTADWVTANPAGCTEIKTDLYAQGHLSRSKLFLWSFAGSALDNPELKKETCDCIGQNHIEIHTNSEWLQAALTFCETVQ